MMLLQRFGSILRSTPIEFYLLVVGGAILLATAWCIDASAFHTSNAWWLLTDIGSATLALYFLLGCIGFLVWGIGSKVTRPYRTRTSWLDTHSFHATLPGVLMFSSQILSAVLIGELVAWLFHAASPDRALTWSTLFLTIDVTMFGSAVYEHLVGAIAPHSILSHIVITTYEYFAVLPTLVALLLIVHSVQRFREYFISFVLLHLFALPMWYLMPAIAPAGLLIDRTLPFATGTTCSVCISVAHARTTYAGTYWAERTDSWRTFWKRDDGSLPVSTNPSMHVAWGMLVVLYLFRITPLLGYIGTILQCINGIGTIYLLQHYTLDVVFGCILAVLAYCAARSLIALEGRVLSVNAYRWFIPWHVAHGWVRTRVSDVRAIYSAQIQRMRDRAE